MKDEISVTAPAQNDRIMAALGHATAILPMTGIIAPIVIWVTKRDKSEYVAFQALQAVVYQLTIILAWFAGMALYMGSFFGMFFSIPTAGPSRSMPVFVIVPFAIMGIMLVGSLLFVIYGLVAAAMALQGKDFRYIVIGNQLKRWLERK